VAKVTPECSAHKIVDEAVVVGKDGSLANVVVYLRTKKPDISPDYEKTAKDEVVLDNKECRFNPHVSVLRTSQTLLVKNSDKFGHNTKLDPLQNAPSNVLLPAGQESKATLAMEESLPVKVGCNIHPWMGGWVLVRSDPYAAVSADDGKFTIKALPAGKELEFQLWQERAATSRTCK